MRSVSTASRAAFVPMEQLKPLISSKSEPPKRTWCLHDIRQSQQRGPDRYPPPEFYDDLQERSRIPLDTSALRELDVREELLLSQLSKYPSLPPGTTLRQFASHGGPNLDSISGVILPRISLFEALLTLMTSALKQSILSLTFDLLRPRHRTSCLFGRISLLVWL